MHKLRDTDSTAEMTIGAPFGPGFSAEVVARATRMEVWGTSLGDAGEYCEFRLLDAENRQIASRRVEGY